MINKPNLSKNVIRIFSKNDILVIKEYEKQNDIPYGGYLYVLEYDDGVKIGSTERPSHRVQELIHMFEKYGNKTVQRIALTPSHTNFRENETITHLKFKEHRIEGTELFTLPIERVIDFLNFDILFKDESLLKEKEAYEVFNGLKKIMIGDVIFTENMLENLSNNEIDIAIELLNKFKNVKSDVESFFASVFNRCEHRGMQ